MGNKRNRRKKNNGFDETEKRTLKDSDKGSWYDQPTAGDDPTPGTSAADVQPSDALVEGMESVMGSGNFSQTEPKPAASEKKITIEDDDCDVVPTEQLEGYRLVNMTVLASTLAKSFVCGSCKTGSLDLSEDEGKRQGWASLLCLTCSDCGNLTQFWTSSKASTWETKVPGMEINQMAVLGMRAIGKGRAAARTLSAHLNLPAPMQTAPWASATRAIQTEVSDVASEHMQDAVSELKVLKIQSADIDSIPRGTELTPALVKDTVVDVAVTFDGSWKNRGLQSRHGFVSAISVDTGRVLDCVYLTNLCKICKKNDDLDKSSMEYLDFVANHEMDCLKNHEGSSQSMEAAGVLQLYERSLERYNLRYTTFIGDGDSSAYSRVVNSNPYGDDHMVQKEECVGHVQKRMGTRLRRLVECLKSQKLCDGKGIQGRGRLTVSRINIFQAWYGKCLRDNKGNPEAASRGTLAILYHYAEEESHEYCPEGSSSWCKFQVDKALGTSTHQPCSAPLPSAIVDILLPVFKDLSDTKLLSSCSRAMTQNQNESLHHVIWSLVPKEQYNSTVEVQLASDLAVLYFNTGKAVTSEILYRRLGLTFSPQASKMLKALDRNRVYHSRRQSSPEYKHGRMSRRYGRSNKALAFVKGSSDYKSGKFHVKRTSSEAGLENISSNL